MGLDNALFIGDTIHPRPVTLGDGTEHMLHFREVPNPVLRRFTLIERSDDDEVRATSMAFLVAASLCEESGKPALTIEQAARLKPTVLGQCFEHALAINSFGDDEKKA